MFKANHNDLKEKETVNFPNRKFLPPFYFLKLFNCILFGEYVENVFVIKHHVNTLLSA